MRHEPIRSPDTACAPHGRAILACADGDSWMVTFSPGIERFIGPYRRLKGFGMTSLVTFEMIGISLN